ncbi:MAG TPA: lysophospholipid acyltransferase family protein, partial [Candidatus Polarisedimenticolaceae bacterium]|nr:lysophospholipid acyltransferase family protein [Candidatus Polarisedimenticolaceae bacterium]
MRRLLRDLALVSFHLLVVRPVLRWLVGVRFRRRGLLPAGPCLVVSNHNSHLDAPILMSMFPLARLRRVHPVAAADYFGQSWLRRTMAMLLMNGIAIERHARSGQDPLAPVAEALREGQTLILFPEGSRGEAGVIAPFRPGVGRLAQLLPGLVVVPVHLTGPERIWPRGRVVPVPFNIDVFVGKPRSYDPALEAREIAEQVQRD